MACLRRSFAASPGAALSISRDQWRTIPAWLRVKERKTPRM